ncbi:hypothetical protein C5167_015478 [Papaver somniferum]|uniref:Uncharacterized protein n=1 Tax=Papaver somniferum TaxID=3469 RepID=A0A4Y7J742_PAPSO|nr:hypothetical protein C5167_015478 [Papaver somniferum]
MQKSEGDKLGFRMPVSPTPTSNVPDYFSSLNFHQFLLLLVTERFLDEPTFVMIALDESDSGVTVINLVRTDIH